MRFRLFTSIQVMVDASQSNKVKEIIAYLQQNQHNEIYSAKNRGSTNDDIKEASIRSSTIQDFNNIHEGVESAISSGPAKVPCNPIVLHDLNAATKIKNIISKLKRIQQINSENGSVSTASLTAETHIAPCYVQTDNLENKKTDECELNNSEFISKSSYLHKQNNKRLKTTHTAATGGQLRLTEFYSVTKSIKDNGKNSTSCCDTSFPQTAVSINYNINHNSEGKDLHFINPNGNNSILCKEQNDSNLKQRKIFDIVQYIKNKHNGYNAVELNKKVTKIGLQKPENSIIDSNSTNVSIQKEQKLKTVSGSCVNKSKTTLDDICNKIKNDSKKQEYINNNFPCKGNSLLKSYSTGNITQDKETCRDANSLPITDIEIKNVEKRLQSTFEGFIQTVWDKIKNKAQWDNVSETSKSEQISRVNSTLTVEAETKENLSVTNVLNVLRDGKRDYFNSPASIMPSQSGTQVDKCTNDFSCCDIQAGNTELPKPFLSSNVSENTDNQFVVPVSKYNRNLGKKIENNDFDNTCKTMGANSRSGSLSGTNFSEHSQGTEMQNDLLREYCRYSFSQNTQVLNDFNRSNSTTDLIDNWEQTRSDLNKHATTANNFNGNLEDSLEANINVLEDGLQKTALTSIYKRYSRRYSSGKNCKSGSFVKNLIPNIRNRVNESNKPLKNKLLVKRYKKGKTKIYKIRRLKRNNPKAEDNDTGLNLEDMLRQISSNHSNSATQILRSKSDSSISTSSSYITDDTKSDTLSTGSKGLTSPQRRLRSSFNELSRDKSLCYSGDCQDIPEHDKEDIKMKIQEIFLQILEDFRNNKNSCFKHRRQTFNNCVFKEGRLQFKPMAESSMTIIDSSREKSQAKFQVMLYVLNKIQTLLETDNKLTKRELYYQMKSLISDQRITDTAINLISCMLDVGMWALNIIAQKGLVFGDLKLLLSSGEMLNCNVQGTLIPQDINDIVEVHSTAYFILVVEKESIFHKLIQENLPNKLTRPFIMITGKGFPDLNTQLFLRKLWMVMSIPVFILVDADPHGINIMLNYRFGSVHNAHVSEYLAVPNAKWLGVYPSEVINLNIPKQPLTQREIRLVNCILQTPYMEFSPRLVDELRILLTQPYKASIEGLIKTDTYLSEVYLPNKFFTHNFI
ncbi:hypothetical protein NQ315_003431 [Exocentrus adspersus]|uniref:DNA topoisomerase (ATP-hydrolyzing) n=1 Tax=Exocentrus adspersus TaxID=1586481 RepID=A0AAV8VMR0_9CUCU|nr:hypothetical protein NQ315_003431 [Exocentrus adspersus]